MGLTIVSPIFLFSLFFDFDWRRISLHSGKEGNAASVCFAESPSSVFSDGHRLLILMRHSRKSNRKLNRFAMFP